MAILVLPWRRGAAPAKTSKAPPPIVVLKNRATGHVLDHFNGQSIQAFDDDERHPRHQWRREPTDKGFVAYRNVATGMVLDNYGGRSIEALSDNVDDHHHQWREVSVGGGFVAIQNRKTGKTLAHWAGEAVRAPSDAVDCVHHQWQVLEARLASRVVALQNRATGHVVAHHLGVSIEALDDDASRAHHQWHRVWLQNGYVAFLNVATGMVLEHHGGRSIQALDSDLCHLHHQWREVDVGGGFMAFQNRDTGKVLEHWYGESIQARHDTADHVDRQWRVLDVHPSADHDGDDDWEDSILLEDGPLANAMLTVLPEPSIEDGESSGGWAWPNNNSTFPAVNAGASSRRQLTVGALLHRSIPAAIRLLAERFSDVARYLALDEARTEIDRMAPLFRPIRRSQGVQLFAHHDVVLTLVQLFDHYRASSDAFAGILSRLGPDLIRDNGSHDHESMRSFLLRPMAPSIVESILDDATRGQPGNGIVKPTLASLTQEKLVCWRQFVPLPLSDQFQGIHRVSKSPIDSQTAPLTLWELVVLFFRIIEAQLELEHGVGLARFTLQYNSITIAPNAASQTVASEYKLVRHGRLDVLRLTGSAPGGDDAGMCHVVTFRDASSPGVETIPEFSVGFVLRAADPNAILVGNPGVPRPFVFKPSATADHTFELRRNARYYAGPHYHLVTFPGGLDAVERWVNQSDVGNLDQGHFLGTEVNFYLTPDAVNGLENVPFDERVVDEDDEL